MMMQNDVGEKVRLDTLQAREHLYGLGAVENLDGEILIWDGEVRVSRIRDNSIETVRGGFEGSPDTISFSGTTMRPIGALIIIRK